jgi:3-hydroxyisobutyrate dehydrogenase-like beta-hydroxyacid dehydrogenase
MKAGFIGMGSMGRGMATSLLRAGHEVTVYNRTPEKAQSVVAQGAHLAESIAEACRADVVVTMLADDDAVESVVLGDAGVLRNLPPQTVHVSCSTIGVGMSERLHAAHLAARQRFVAATVFGRPDVAAAGRLLIVAAGARRDVETAVPALEAMGRQTHVVSDRPPAANLVKLSGNFLIASMIESLGEAMALAERGGIDRRRHAEIISSLFECPPYRTYSTLIAEERYEPAGFAAPLGQKDIRLALAAADALQLSMPVAELLRSRFETLMDAGGERLDWSAIAHLAALGGGRDDKAIH